MRNTSSQSSKRMSHHNPSNREDNTRYLSYMEQGAMVIQNIVSGRKDPIPMEAFIDKVDPTCEVPIWAQELALRCQRGQLETA